MLSTGLVVGVGVRELEVVLIPVVLGLMVALFQSLCVVGGRCKPPANRETYGLNLVAAILKRFS